jgi:hypothetical protein
MIEKSVFIQRLLYGKNVDETNRLTFQKPNQRFPESFLSLIDP